MYVICSLQSILTKAILVHSTYCLLDGVFKNLSFKIAMSGRAGRRRVGGRRRRFTFWLTFLKNLSIMLLVFFLLLKKMEKTSINYPHLPIDLVL